MELKQGTRKRWQIGHGKMLCTDRPKERLNTYLVFYKRIITIFTS